MKSRLLLWSFLLTALSLPLNAASTSSSEIQEPPQLEQNRLEADSLIQQYKSVLTHKNVSNRVKALSMQRIAEIQMRMALHDEDRVSEKRLDEAINFLNEILVLLPNSSSQDDVYYQLGRAYALKADMQGSRRMMQTIRDRFPESKYYQEAVFRLAENDFLHERYMQAMNTYKVILEGGSRQSIFYTKARYMYAWSLFKVRDYTQAAQAFSELLDRYNDTDQLDKNSNELQQDLIRGLGLSLSELYRGSELTDIIESTLKEKPYTEQLYQWLADYSIEKERYQDASNLLSDFSSLHADVSSAPKTMIESIRVLERAGFSLPAIEKKKLFVQRYALNGSFWKNHAIDDFEEEIQYLDDTLYNLALHYHSKARKQDSSLYPQAIQFYRDYLEQFANRARAPEINYLLAEALYETGDYVAAAEAYEQTAYDYQEFEKSADAGYAALLAYKKLDTTDKNNLQWQGSANRFIETFKQHPQRKTIITNLIAALFQSENWDGLIGFQKKQLAEISAHQIKQRMAAWELIGDAEVKRNDYTEAIQAYEQALSVRGTNNISTKDLTKKLAATYYKNGERAREKGLNMEASNYFLLAQQATSDVSIASVALYDAGIALLKESKPDEAAQAFEAFKKKYPRHKLQKNIPQLLASIYQQTNQPLKAAVQYERLSQISVDVAVQKESLWTAASLYEKNKNLDKAVILYKRYIQRFPNDFLATMDARKALASIRLKQNKVSANRYWLKEIIKAEQLHAESSNDYTQLLAAKASLVLADDIAKEFHKKSLKVPLEQSMESMKVAMKKALKAYQKSMDYGLAETTSKAVFKMGDLYDQFSKKIMQSQRPKGLTEAEMEEYGFMLEDLAFEYEEQAIALHKTNYGYLQKESYYDQAIQASLHALAQLVPGIYAKPERTLDIYVSLD